MRLRKTRTAMGATNATGVVHSFSASAFSLTRECPVIGFDKSVAFYTFTDVAEDPGLRRDDGEYFYAHARFPVTSTHLTTISKL